MSRAAARAGNTAGMAAGMKEGQDRNFVAQSAQPLMLSDQRQARAIISGGPTQAGGAALQRSLSQNQALQKLQQALSLTPEQSKGADYQKQLEYLERKAAGGVTHQVALQHRKAEPVAQPEEAMPTTRSQEERRWQEELMEEVRAEIQMERQKERERRQRELEAADAMLVNTYGAGKSTAISISLNDNMHHVFDPSKAGEEPQEEDYEEWYEDELPEVGVDAPDLDSLHRMWGMDEPQKDQGSEAGDSAAGRRRQPAERPDRPPAYVLARQQSLREQGLTSKVNPIAPPKRDRSKAQQAFQPYVPQGRAGESLVVGVAHRPVSISFGQNGAAPVQSSNGQQQLQAPMRIGSLSRQRSAGGAMLQPPAVGDGPSGAGPAPPRRGTGLRTNTGGLLIPGPTL